MKSEKALAVAYATKRRAEKTSKGGMAMPEHAKMPMSETEDHYDSIADAILAKKRKASQMADGGMVDLDLNEEEIQPDDLEDRNIESAEEDPEHDIVASVMRKRKKS